MSAWGQNQQGSDAARRADQRIPPFTDGKEASYALIPHVRSPRPLVMEPKSRGVLDTPRAGV
jgi:hypothetical protein